VSGLGRCWDQPGGACWDRVSMWKAQRVLYRPGAGWKEQYDHSWVFALWAKAACLSICNWVTLDPPGALIFFFFFGGSGFELCTVALD
jgi:hypothetical protein